MAYTPQKNEARSNARLRAVQALYQMELTDQKSKLVLREFDEHWLEIEEKSGETQTDQTFFEMIVLGVVAEQEAVDAAVKAKLNSKWKLHRLDIILRAIMRCSSYEILRVFDVPAITIIDEYVGLANDFYDGGEPKFVNAALDRLAREHRPAEFSPEM